MNLTEWKERIRNEKTRNLYVRHMERFLKFHKCTSSDTLKWKPKAIAKRIDDYKVHLQDEGKSGSAIFQFGSAISRWYSDNLKPVSIRFRNVSTQKKVFDYIPTKEDIKRMLMATESESPPKYALAMMLMCQSGMRPSDVLQLQYEHVKLSYEAGDEVVTALVKQKKTENPYVTFLSPMAVFYLKRTLEERMQRGEEITDDSYLMSDDGKITNEGTFKENIARIIKAEIGEHPTNESFRRFRRYGLRKFFRRAAFVKFDKDTAEYFMGHIKGLQSLTATYSGLADMDLEAIKILKQKYVEELLPALDLDVQPIEPYAQTKIKELEDKVEKFNGMFKDLLGIPIDDHENFFPALVDWIHEYQEREIEEQTIVEQRELEPIIQQMREPAQKIIKMDELEEYISRGWRFIHELNGSDKAVVEK